MPVLLDQRFPAELCQHPSVNRLARARYTQDNSLKKTPIATQNQTYLDSFNPLMAHLPHPLTTTHYFPSKSNPLGTLYQTRLGLPSFLPHCALPLAYASLNMLSSPHAGCSSPPRSLAPHLSTAFSSLWSSVCNCTTRLSTHHRPC